MINQDSINRVYKKEYFNGLRQDTDNAAKSNENTSSLLFQSLDQNMPKPKEIPDHVWQNMSGPQKGKKYIRSWQNRIKNEPDILDTDSLIRMCNPELVLSDQFVKTLKLFLSYSRRNDKNPTLKLLAGAIASAEKERRPIEIIVSQCIAKAEGLREGKLNFFVNGDDSKKTQCRFSDNIEKKGWNELKSLLSESNYPVKLRLVLGDMDYYTMDACHIWCDKSSMEKLAEEMNSLRMEIETEASSFFSNFDISVELWSEHYQIDRFNAEMSKARCPHNWDNRDDILAATNEIYLNQWGYRSIAKRQGFSLEKITNFIEGDLDRAAAQYRIESNIVNKAMAIQGWAESVPRPLWPIQLSNYDGSGYAPSIILV